MRTNISAETILDSKNHENERLTTLRIVLPKSFLAQFNTHRVFSRNFSSSRAIPVKKVIQSVIDDPVMPIWTENQPGMVGKRITDPDRIAELDAKWLASRDLAVLMASDLAEMGGHKQTVNRILEPYMYAQGIVTSSDYEWFFFLRNADAQPEIEELSKAMGAALKASTPRLMGPDDEGHIPFILPEEAILPFRTKVMVAVARIARTSYKTFDNDKLSTVDKDIELFKDLYEKKHLSPFEGVAFPSSDTSLSGNFNGHWTQLRKLVEKDLW